MRFFLLTISIFLISCSKQSLKTEVIDINKKMTFEEFRILIEKNGNIKDYPNID
tara:strand:- start:869 stop:1030 length:162 start_codon:yes stop_codon:yes gene_type:complete